MGAKTKQLVGALEKLFEFSAVVVDMIDTLPSKLVHGMPLCFDTPRMLAQELKQKFYVH